MLPGKPAVILMTVCILRKYLSSSMIIMAAFGNRSFNESVRSIDHTNNLSFTLIYYFSLLIFTSNRCFGSSFGKFNVITGILDNFLTRKKVSSWGFDWVLNTTLQSYLYSVLYICIQFSVSVFTRSYSKKSFSKFLEMLTQPEIICSKLTIETLEKGVKYVQS